MKSKVFVVDDDPDILQLLEYHLKEKEMEVQLFESGLDCYHYLDQEGSEVPDLILLDVMMPNLGGLETCQRIRTLELDRQPLIAFLTAKTEDYSQLSGFEAGGDDYILKPIRPKVLMHRVEALLRHAKRLRGDSDRIEFKDLLFAKENYTILKDGQVLDVSRKEFQILSLLMGEPKKVFKRSELFDLLWPDQFDRETRTLDVHILKLRKKLGEGYIRTVKGVGYGLDS